GLSSGKTLIALARRIFSQACATCSDDSGQNNDGVFFFRFVVRKIPASVRKTPTRNSVDRPYTRRPRSVTRFQARAFDYLQHSTPVGRRRFSLFPRDYFAVPLAAHPAL